MILVAGGEPGQSSGRYPISRQNTRFDRWAGGTAFGLPAAMGV